MSMRAALQFICVALAAMMLFPAASNASETPSVGQAAVGTCNQNSVTYQTVNPVASGRPGGANPTLKAAGLPCVVVQISHELNALEHAQLQLLIAEHPTRVSAGPASVGVRLGERAASIWIDVRNDSSYDIHNVWIEQARDAHKTRYRVAKDQTYRTAKLPDAVVTTRNLILSGGESATLLAANPLYIAKALTGVPEDWCLYDISSRASDLDLASYEEASNAELERSVATGEFRSGHSESQSIGTVFTVRYADIFDVPHEVSMQIYLRVAPTNSGSVFYPSRHAFGPLECIATLLSK
jgi:hypothetical protein